MVIIFIIYLIFVFIVYCVVFIFFWWCCMLIEIGIVYDMVSDIMFIEMNVKKVDDDLRLISLSSIWIIVVSVRV